MASSHRINSSVEIATCYVLISYSGWFETLLKTHSAFEAFNRTGETFSLLCIISSQISGKTGLIECQNLILSSEP